MRLRALDSLRILAAMMVVLYHLPILNSIYLSDWLRHARTVLELFFILSGFVMAMVYGDRISGVGGLKTFLVRRVSRLWPPHAVILALWLVMELGRAVLWNKGLLHTGDIPFTHDNSIPAFVKNLFLVQSWGWSPDKLFTWNYPSWSVSTEFAAYILMAVMSVLATNLRTRICAALAISVLAAASYFHQSHGFDADDYVSVSRCMMGFFLGYVIYFVWKARPIRSRLTGSTVEIAAVAGAYFAISANLTGMSFLLSPLIFGLMVYAFASEKGVVSDLLKIGPLPRFGEMSYSIYISHALVLEMLKLVFLALQKAFHVSMFSAPAKPPIGERESVVSIGGVHAMDLLTLATLAVVLVFGAWVYRHVEAPTRVRRPVKAAASGPSSYAGAVQSN